MARRILICGAFATWCFLNTWVEYAEGRIAYFARYDPLQTVALPVICCEAVVALAIWAIWEVGIRGGWAQFRAFHWLFLIGCLAPVGIAAVAVLLALPFDLGPMVRSPAFWPSATIGAIVPVLIAVRRPFVATRAMRLLFLYSWPVLAVVYFQAGRQTLLRYPEAAYSDGALAAPLSGTPQVRAIWIIFDELSQTIAFGNRPAGMSLPNFDRLQRGSFYATAARSPANVTEVSMPALILGRMLAGTMANSPRELLLKIPDAPGTTPWSSLPNVFDKAREIGLNTALIGWAHPYGRVLNRSLTQCYWTAGWLSSGAEETFQRMPLPAAMLYRVKLQIAALPLLGHVPGRFPGFYQRSDKQDRFSYLMDRARDVVSDQSIGLALIHLPIPHPPGIYSRATRTLSATGAIGYLDSVALADQALGSLMDALEKSGLSNRTAILLSADHGWRTSVWRGTAEWTREEDAASNQDTSGVPFLLKLPGQTAQVNYPAPFNTVVTARILEDILTHRLDDPEKIGGLIERSQVGK